MNFVGFSFEIGATIVGIFTIVIIGFQMYDQRKLNQRIADMQYAKLMEHKLLAIVYAVGSGRETNHSVPSIEWYTFHFMRGYISPPSNAGREMFYIFPTDDTSDRKNGNTFYNVFFKKKQRNEYTKTYNKMIQKIKTPDIRKHYEDSNFGKLVEIIPTQIT